MSVNHGPLLVSWNITRECNLRCRHCYRDAGTRSGDELTTAEGFRLIDEIVRAGFPILVLSGGEPLMRPDLFELITRARAGGLRVVLGSNGTLIDNRMAHRLLQAGVARVGISLDSVHPENHDRFRRRAGAFEQARAGMEACKAAGLPFQVHTTVRESNADEVTAITDLAVESGSAGHHIFFLVPTGRGLNLADEQLKAVAFEKLLHQIVRKQQETPIELKPTCAPTFMRIARQQGIDMRFSRGCLTGRSYCVVLPDGDVHPCPYLPLRVGNVRETPFDHIWTDSAVFCRFREEVPEGRCGCCEYESICGGCRARAYWQTGGNYMAEDHWCLYRPHKR